MKRIHLKNSLEFLFDYHANRNNAESINIVKITRGMIRLLKSGQNPLASFDLPLASKGELTSYEKFQLSADVEEIILSILNDYNQNKTSKEISTPLRSTKNELEVRINGEFKGFFEVSGFINFIKTSRILRLCNKAKTNDFLRNILNHATENKGTCTFYSVAPCDMTTSEISVRYRYMH